ncbi:Hypothetical predicted protein [Cloeon dipterum]|uniref:Uncharacterized protein n=1 Tax=Cloeon dipterum TaxID=197152 RepID=A0A8S1DRU1_9INSE|nr:Hypothetical predicted protein [Cloeon dipterum]
MRDNQCIYLSCNLSFGNTIWPGKDLFDISSAFWWPAEFVRRNPTSAANWIDHLNFSIRLCIVALFVALEFSSPPDIQEFVTSKTIQAALYLSRIALIAHQVLALLQSRSFGQFISEALPRLQLNSFMSIIPSILHLILLPCKLFIGRNPFTSLQNTPLLFGHMSLSGCITTLALATIVIEVCQQKVIFDSLKLLKVLF